MKRLLVFALCLATTVLAQDSPAKFREYLDAAATVEKFSGAVLVAHLCHAEEDAVPHNSEQYHRTHQGIP
jgi:hypothetical protein